MDWVNRPHHTIGRGHHIGQDEALVADGGSGNHHAMPYDTRARRRRANIHPHLDIRRLGFEAGSVAQRQ